MEFRYLGPLEVKTGEELLHLAGKRQRRLLAVLLVHAGEVVPHRRLAEMVLGRPPGTASSSTLQSHVSVLRRTLAGDDVARVQTHPTGYCFVPGPGDLLDGRRFESGVAAARAALAAGEADRARRTLDSVLLLWRGTPLPELDDVFELQAETGRLEELQLSAFETRADALLALGQPATVVTELERLAQRHPLRESLWERLILAYYRSGRQSEALRSFQLVRVALARELGIDPGPVLRRLQEDILAQSPDLEVVTPGPVRASSPGPSDPGFVGRRSELEAAQRAFDRAGRGAGSLLLVAGGAGMGKTRLAGEIARLAGPSGAAWGAATPESGAPPFWPWTQVLRSVVGPAGVEPRWPGDDTTRMELERLVSLDAADTTIPAGGAARSWEADEARFRLFDAITQLLRQRAADGPLVIVLDDIHWADPSSLRLLAHMAPELQSAPVVLVATYRNQPGDLEGALPETLASLARIVGRESLELAPLSSQEISVLLHARVGEAPSEPTRAEVERLSGGVPFFVAELAHRIRSDGTLAPGVPVGAQDALRFRLRSVPAGVAGLLELAAVFGDSFTVDDLVLLAGDDPSIGGPEEAGPPAGRERGSQQVTAAVEAARRADLLAASATHPGRWSFRHDILRSAVLELIEPARRASLHLTVGQRLDGRPGVAPGQIVHHFVEAAALGGAPRAIELCRAAAVQAIAATGYEEAVELMETAVRLAESHGSGPAELVDLLLALGDARWWAGDADGARANFELAAARARAAGLAREMARAALGYGGTSFSIFYVQTGVAQPRHVALLRQALDAIGPEDDPLRAMALAQLGVALYWAPGGLEEAERATREALAMARRLGDPLVLIPVIVNRLLAAWGPDTLEERLALPGELRTMGRTIGRVPTEWAGVAMSVPGLMERGDLGGVDRLLVEAEAVLERIGRPTPNSTMVTIFRACLALTRGELGHAEETVMDAYRKAERFGDLDALQILGVHLAMLRRDEGRIAEMIPALEQQSQAFPAVPTWKLALALGLCDLDRLDAARAAMAGAGDPDELPRDFQWLCGMAMWSEVAAALSDAEAGAELYRLMAPYAGRNVLTSTAIAAWGSSDRYIGLAAAAHGEHGLAEVHLRAAIDHNAAMGATPWKLRSTRDLARVLRTVGGPARRAEADTLTTAYRAEAAAIGMVLT